MSRKYSRRTASTSRKTYADYLRARADLEAKGYQLKDVMSKGSFETYYDRLIAAKKAGEIKSGAWQTLIVKEKYLSTKQATALSKAYAEMHGEKASIKKIRGLSKQEIGTIGAYLTAHKADQALFGGMYE